MKNKTMWFFGYNGAKELYWLMACSKQNLLNQINERGLDEPDWTENTGHSS